MCRTITTIEDKISNLSHLSTKVSSLTVSDRLSLVNELIIALQNQDWSNDGDWLKDELILRQLMDKNEQSLDSSSSAKVKEMASNTRYGFGVVIMNYLTSLKESLEYQLSKTDEKSSMKTPDILAKVRTETTPEGTVQVHGPLPTVPQGPTFEAWCEPIPLDENAETTAKTATTGATTTSHPSEDGIALVLGAGNSSALGLIDTLQCFFLHPQKPILIKHHPLRPFLYHPFDTLLQPLIQRGYVDHILDEGLEHTQTRLLKNKLVQHVHVTGSYFTSKAIKEYMAKERSDVDKVSVEKMVTSELGCSSPWVVSPGKYEDAELKSVAKLIAQAKKTCGGTFCLAAQVLVVPEKWEQKETLIAYVTDALSARTTEPCYYPGSTDRCQKIIQHYKDLGKDRVISTTAPLANDAQPAPEQSQVSLVRCGCVGTDGYDGKALKQEAFGPVLAIAELPQSKSSSGAEDDEKYLLETAMPFVNDKSMIFGSLSGVILAPQTMAKSTITKAVAAMKYGTVAVNCWSLFGYIAMTKGAVWCGHARDGAGQSGDGYVGNMYGIDRIEKTVLYGGSLVKSPPDDPPTIVYDILNQIALSKTNLGAFVNVWIMLAIRTIAAFLPSFLKGKRTYGAVY